MKRLLLILVSCILLNIANATNSDSPPILDMQKFRTGDICEASRYFQSPIILVSEFKTECEQCHGAEWKTVTIHYCRVVSSNCSDLPVNSIVVYRISYEKTPQLVPPNGQLLYIISPNPRQISSLNGVIELYDYCVPLPLHATQQQIDSARRRTNARLHNQ